MRRAGHFTTFLSYEARNPCLRIGDVVPSLFFFVRLFVGRFGRGLGQKHSLPSLGFSVGLSGLAMCVAVRVGYLIRSEEHTSELQSRENLVCRLLLEKNNTHNG